MTGISLFATPLYLGLNLILTTVLAMMVVRQRLATSTLIGDGNKENMRAAVRVHGNNTEYMPGAMILIGVLELMGSSMTLLHGLGILFTLSRIVHAWALNLSLGTSAGRVIGTLGSWLVYLIGAVACLIKVIGT